MSSQLSDDPAEIARDVAAVRAISAVPVLLKLLCSNTGLRFAAVARVTDGTWVACAVQDDVGLGLMPGSHLAIETTLCRESRAMRRPIVIDDVATDVEYRAHHTPQIYGLQSYISVPIIRSDGEYFGNLCALDRKPAILSGAQTVAMFIAYAELIGQQLEVEDERQETLRALEEQRRRGDLLEEFIAVLGHDLRNPLQAIDASAQILIRSRSADPEVIGHCIANSSRRMSKLIDDVLDFTRGRLGADLPMQLRSESALSASLEGVVQELQRAHPLRTVLSEIDITEPVVCDRSRLEQLLSNLLANALHHGAPDLPVRVRAALVDGTLRLSVLNGGPPIATEHLDRIFEPYWRPATSLPGGGLGLGLHICSKIVAAHGGSLEVTSSAEYGTEFVASMPLGAISHA